MHDARCTMHDARCRHANAKAELPGPVVINMLVINKWLSSALCIVHYEISRLRRSAPAFGRRGRRSLVLHHHLADHGYWTAGCGVERVPFQSGGGQLFAEDADGVDVGGKLARDGLEA